MTITAHDARRLARDPRLYQLAAVGQAVDAAVCIQPIPYVQRCLTDVEFPRAYWRAFPIVKAASAIGLGAAPRYPALTRLTTAMLTVYFCFAAGSHVRTRDLRLNFLAASSLLAFYSALTLTGPPRTAGR